MKKLVFFSAMFLLTIAGASGAEHGAHSNEIPQTVLWQFLNLAILFGGLFYYLKDSVVQTFSKRREVFLVQAEKSKAAQKSAESEFLDIKHKLDILNSTANESISRARAEANDLKEKLLKEAQAASERIRKDAEETIKVEAEKALQHLKVQVILDAIAAARTVLSKDIGSSDHQNLQNEFTKNIQVVSP